MQSIPERPIESMWSHLGWRSFWRGDHARPTTLCMTPGGKLLGLEYSDLYSDAFRGKLWSETTWLPVNPGSAPRLLSRDEVKQVGLGEITCPLCNGRGHTDRKHVGEETGIEVVVRRRCLCEAAQLYWRYWSRIPSRYREVSYEEMAPAGLDKGCQLSLATQAKIIDYIKANPEQSYLLHGPGGTGKTHISFALHQRALRNWVVATSECNARSGCPVFRATTPDLLREHHDWATKAHGDDTRCPSINEGKIRGVAQDGYRPLLILDELDKLGNPTEFKLTTIFRLMDAVYESKGQIVCTSNHSPDQLIEMWGEEYGRAILRRCGQVPDGQSIRFSEPRNKN